MDRREPLTARSVVVAAGTILYIVGRDKTLTGEVAAVCEQLTLPFQEGAGS